jgi:hypothetical protein
MAPQMKCSRATWLWIPINDRSDETSRADVLHQRDRALQRRDGRVHVDSAFEPRRRFRLESQPLAGAPD